MRIQDVIKNLQILEAEHGEDLDVRFVAGAFPDDRDADDSVPIEGITLLCDADEVPVYALICDAHSLDGFMNGDDFTDADQDGG